MASILLRRRAQGSTGTAPGFFVPGQPGEVLGNYPDPGQDPTLADSGSGQDLQDPRGMSQLCAH